MTDYRGPCTEAGRCARTGECPLYEACAEAARGRRLEVHRRYNHSAKGQARDARYEARHPERKLRWEPARNALRSPLGPAPDGPMP